MADTTYAEIKTQVQYNLGRGADADILAQLDMWARFAVRDVVNYRDGWFLEAQVDIPTVIDQQAYAFPTDYKDNMVITIRKTDQYVPLNGPIDVIEAQRRFTPDSEGEPTDWSHYMSSGGAEQFLIWPVKPDAVYTLQMNYMRYITDLSAVGDTNILTIKYPQLLVALMTMYGFKYLQEHPDAKMWEEDIYGSADRRKPGMLADIHAHYVARTMGRDFHLGARADILGHQQQTRGTPAYIVLR